MFRDGYKIKFLEEPVKKCSLVVNCRPASLRQ